MMREIKSSRIFFYGSRLKVIMEKGQSVALGEEVSILVGTIGVPGVVKEINGETIIVERNGMIKK